MDPADTPATDSDGQELLELTCPDDVIAVAAHLLGYHPSPGDLVLLALCDSKVVLTVRLSLHLGQQPLTLRRQAAVWSRLRTPLEAHDVQEVIAVAYCEESGAGPADEFLAGSRWPVIGALRVHAGLRWHLRCPGAACRRPDCHPDGVPVTDRSSIMAAYVLAGRAVHASRLVLGATLRPGPAETVAAVAALLPLSDPPSPQALYQLLRAAWQDRREPPGPPLGVEQAATLLAAVSDPDIRDACLVWDDDGAWRLWTELIRYAPPGYVAPIASVLALAAYQRGDGTSASITADLALLDRPGYGLAVIARDLAAMGTAPDVLRRHALDGEAPALARLRRRSTPDNPAADAPAPPGA